MNLKRHKEIVNQYHFDARNADWEKQNGVPETGIKVEFQLIEHNKEENKTVILTILKFMVVLDEFVISGVMTQAVEILERIVEGPQEFNDEDRKLLVAPLLDILKRLTYEVTEIALDMPGINLEF